MFFQDDYKVRPNLTLNLGLRWEYTQPVYEVADRQVNVDLQTGQPRFAGQNGIEKQFHITERQYFDLRADFFNALNHANIGPPARVNSNPASFGAITSAVGTPRNIQLGLLLLKRAPYVQAL